MIVWALERDDEGQSKPNNEVIFILKRKDNAWWEEYGFTSVRKKTEFLD